MTRINLVSLHQHPLTTFVLLMAFVLVTGCGGAEEPGTSSDGGFGPDFRFIQNDQGTTEPPAYDSEPRDGSTPLVDSGDGPPPDSAVTSDLGTSEADTGTPDMMAPDMDVSPPEPAPDPLSEDGVDTDGDGLDDAWETGAADIALLDPQTPDTDGDGVPDGEEDFDEDGLTNLQEQAAGRMESMTASHRPHPFRGDILIELDSMADRMISPDILQLVVDAYADSAHQGASGHTGIGIHFYGDQFDIPVEEFNANFGPRQRLLAQNGPLFSEVPESFPTRELVHIIIASRRTDRDTRGGEVITHADDIAKTGVLIYSDTIADVFPRCGLDDPPPVPFVTIPEALAGTLVHELGHTLQLGHDTEVGGGVNPWNIMSVPQGCVSTRQRAHGEGNGDPTLGNTEAINSPRFSNAASDLIDLTNKLSVDTSTLVDGDDGREM